MRFINGERATGKTTKLIYSSYVTGYPIITHTEASSRFLSNYAKSMGCIITVYSYDKWIKDRKYLFYDHAFIDDGMSLITEIVCEHLKTCIVTTAVNIPITEKKLEEYKKDDQ